MKTFLKDPAAILDYVWDWHDWLGTDTITEISFTVPEGITILEDPSPSELDGVVTAWFSGGTLNSSYIVTCKIVTVGGRTDERSGIFKIKDR